jgi:hypothetical protein
LISSPPAATRKHRAGLAAVNRDPTGFTMTVLGGLQITLPKKPEAQKPQKRIPVKTG